jgi:hypothetical protein
MDNVSWSLTGNTGTIPGIHFLGTTDNVDLEIATNNTIRMSVDANGDVGIGTTAPLAPLHISRGTSGGSITVNSKLVLEDDMPTYEQFLTPDGTESGLLFGTTLGSIRAGIFFNSSITDGLEFRTGGNGTRAALTNTGDLGLGTTTPDRHVEINGGGNQYLRVTSSNLQATGIEFKLPGALTDWQIRDQGGSLWFGRSLDDLATVTDVFRIASGYVTPALDNAVSCGSAPLRWTNIFATSGVVSTSDARDKTNIRPLDRGLAELMRLKPVRYQWKDRPEEGDKLGLIAQDLQQVLPETVFSKEWTTREDGTREQVPAQRLGVYYSDLIPVLIKAIQEQQHLIEDLQARIHTLETRH